METIREGIIIWERWPCETLSNDDHTYFILFLVISFLSLYKYLTHARIIMLNVNVNVWKCVLVSIYSFFFRFKRVVWKRLGT